MKPVEILPSGRPAFLQGEVEVSVVPTVEVDQLPNERFLLRLTTHRLILQGKATAQQIALGDIVRVDPQAHGWVNYSTHFTLFLRAVPKDQSYRLSLVGMGEKRDEFLETMARKCREKLWEAPTQEKKPKQEFSAQMAGISGLIKRQEEKHAAVETTLSEAFTDLNKLMENARGLVALAEKLKANHAPSEDAAMDEIAMEFGLSSPVTKELAGNLFYSELARELSDFLAPRLAQNQGILALPDVFCLYNRARGTALVSPEDLHRACLLFEKLKLPVTLRTFESGLVAVQSASFRDDAMLEKIAALARDPARSSTAFPTNYSLFAAREGISFSLASFFLQKAEAKEILCRDESFEGLQFYPNLFAFLPSAANR